MTNEDLPSTEFNLDEFKVTLLMFGHLQGGLEQSAKFLTKRGWPTTVVLQVNDVIRSLIENPPDLVLLSASHPHPAAQKLPDMILQNFNIPCVSFLELPDTKSMANQHNSRCRFKLPGTASGPNLHRGLRKVIDELFNPNFQAENEKSLKSKHQSDAPDQSVRISGTTDDEHSTIQSSSPENNQTHIQKTSALNQNLMNHTTSQFKGSASDRFNQLVSQLEQESKKDQATFSAHSKADIDSTASLTANNLSEKSDSLLSTSNAEQFRSQHESGQKSDQAPVLPDSVLASISGNEQLTKSGQNSFEASSAISQSKSQPKEKSGLTGEQSDTYPTELSLISRGHFSDTEADQKARVNSPANNPPQQASEPNLSDNSAIGSPNSLRQVTANSSSINQQPYASNKLIPFLPKIALTPENFNPLLESQKIETQMSEKDRDWLSNTEKINRIYVYEVEIRDLKGICITVVPQKSSCWEDLSFSSDPVLKFSEESIQLSFNEFHLHDLIKFLNEHQAIHAMVDNLKTPIFSILWEHQLPISSKKSGPFFSFPIESLKQVDQLNLPFYIHLEKNNKFIKYFESGGRLLDRQIKVLAKHKIETLITSKFKFALTAHQFESRLKSFLQDLDRIKAA